MRSIEWWLWRTPNPVSRSLHFWSRISEKRRILSTSFSRTLNTKPYPVYRMVPLSMTLSDLWPGFQGHDIFEGEYRKKARLEDKVTIVQEETIRNILNGTMFGDLDWPLNASRGFVSISWVPYVAVRCGWKYAWHLTWYCFIAIIVIH